MLHGHETSALSGEDMHSQCRRASMSTTLIPLAAVFNVEFQFTYLFDRFRRQNQWTFLLYTNTIFDANTKSSKMLRPSLIIWHINSGLNGNTMTFNKSLFPRIAGAIVHIKSNVMADMMWEERI